MGLLKESLKVYFMFVQDLPFNHFALNWSFALEI